MTFTAIEVLSLCSIVANICIVAQNFASKITNRLTQRNGKAVNNRHINPFNFFKDESLANTCFEKIEKLSAHFAIHGIMYETFEDAILYFQSHGKIQSNSPEIVEFNDIMELLYIGRRAAKKILKIRRLPN